MFTPVTSRNSKREESRGIWWCLFQREMYVTSRRNVLDFVFCRVCVSFGRLFERFRERKNRNDQDPNRNKDRKRETIHEGQVRVPKIVGSFSTKLTGFTFFAHDFKQNPHLTPGNERPTPVGQRPTPKERFFLCTKKESFGTGRYLHGLPLRKRT